MPYSSTEEEFVQRYRRLLEAQSLKQLVPLLEKDENGVAFSTAEGRFTTAMCFSEVSEVLKIDQKKQFNTEKEPLSLRHVWLISPWYVPFNVAFWDLYMCTRGQHAYSV